MESDPFQIRNNLIQKARYGEITGDQADAEAKRLGLGSLSQEPVCDKFRPEAEAYWTLVMSVAWIVYRDLEEVRKWSLPFREECFDWRWQRWQLGFDGPIHEGWLLEQRGRPNLGGLQIGAAYEEAAKGKRPIMPVSIAKEALWQGLHEGLFAASGISSQTGKRTEIPALEWHELVDVHVDGSDEVRFGALGHGYREVLVPAAAIRGLWREAAEKIERLPPIVVPQGEGYMPLFCAAQWIATEGGKIDFNPGNKSVWEAAFGELLAAISTGNVHAVGTREGSREPVPGYHFADCEVDYPFSDPPADLIWGNTLHLRSHPYLDPQKWRRGFDDALVNGVTPRWSRLMVASQDILARWPFSIAKVKTGMPGRPPLAKHLILDELERRASFGQLAPTVSEQALQLVEWVAVAHPDCARPAPGTTENTIRDAYRQLKKTTK